MRTRRSQKSGWPRSIAGWTNSSGIRKRPYRGRKSATKQRRGSVVASNIELLEGARVDFDESFDWYAERSEAAAEGFRDAVHEALDRIAADPEHCSQATRGCRYYPLK